MALDRGRGMTDVGRSMADGVSTAGSPGNGLGALRRLSSELEIYTTADHGTAVLSRVWRNGAGSRPSQRLRIGGVAVAKPGQDVCGDDWSSVVRVNGCTLIIADGLGHGPDAAAAAREAVRIFKKEAAAAPGECIEAIHRGLRPTRGAAVAVAHLDSELGVVRYAGLGNISAIVITEQGATNLVSHHGIAGHEARKIGEFRYNWPKGGALVMYSDGLATHWDLAAYAGLARRDPTLIAAVLYRDHRRGRDDTTVVVVRDDA
jgi:hypothetical protein